MRTAATRAGLIVAASASLAWGIAEGRGGGSPRSSVVIEGGGLRPLFPGAQQALRLTLRNRRHRPVLVRWLHVRVRVDAVHRRAGCSRRDFAIRPVPRRVFPLRLPARSKGRRLAPGRYRIDVVAIDAQGKRARPVRLTLVVRRAGR